MCSFVTASAPSIRARHYPSSTAGGGLPVAEGMQQCRYLGAPFELARVMRDAHGRPQLLHVGDAARAQSQMGVERGAVGGWQRAVHVVADQLDELLTGHAASK